METLRVVNIDGKLLLRETNPIAGIYKLVSKQKDWKQFEETVKYYPFDFKLDNGDIIPEHLCRLENRHKDDLSWHSKWCDCNREIEQYYTLLPE